MKKVLSAGLLAAALLLTCLTGCGTAAPGQPSSTPAVRPTQTVQLAVSPPLPSAPPTPSPTPIPTATPAPEVPSPTAAPQTAAQTTYILNTNTGKFHKPTCSSVDQMKDSNKQPFTGTRDQAIARGYSPCGRCHP